VDLASQLQSCYALYQSGDMQGAEQQIGQILQQFSSEPDAYHLGALIASGMGRNQVALKRVELALDRQNNHHEYWNTKGNILTVLQNVPEAITAFRKSLEAKPDYLAAAQNLGRCLVDNDDAVSAVKLYQKAISHHPGNEQLQVGQIVALKEAVRTEQALGALDALASADKHSFLRGQILLQLGRYQEAIAENKKALSDPSSAALALKNMMQAYWMQDDWENGEKELQTVLQEDRTALDIFITASIIYNRAGQPDLANQCLTQATTKFGDDPDIIATRARLYLESGRNEIAWEFALKALTDRPGDLKLMEIFAEAGLASGRPNDAMVAAQAALKILPNNQFWIAVKYTAGRAMGQDHRFYADTDKFVKTYRLVPPEKYGSIDAFNRELKKALENLHEFKQHPIDQSLRLGTQTLTDLRYSETPVIQDFFEALDDPINSYIAGLGDNNMHPLKNRNTGNYRFAGAWSVLLKAGGHHVNHVHPKGWISSSYYVDVPDEVENENDKAGWIKFGEPPFDVIDQNGKILGPERIIKPEPGLVVLFPSYLWHGTVPITGDSSRLTLPFDAVPA